MAFGGHLKRHMVDVCERSIGPKATQVLAAKIGKHLVRRAEQSSGHPFESLFVSRDAHK